MLAFYAVFAKTKTKKTRWKWLFPPVCAELRLIFIFVFCCSFGKFCCVQSVIVVHVSVLWRDKTREHRYSYILWFILHTNLHEIIVHVRCVLYLCSVFESLFLLALLSSSLHLYRTQSSIAKHYDRFKIALSLAKWRWKVSQFVESFRNASFFFFLCWLARKRT